MLISMTGYGEARERDDHRSVAVEIRAVNNRHFKLSCRVAPPFDALESEIEKLVREFARRGTLHVHLRVDRPKRADDYQLNLVALESYRAQLERARRADEPAPALRELLALPGLVEDARSREHADPREEWPEIARVLRAALERFNEARVREGRAMAEELLRLRSGIAERLAHVEELCPRALVQHRDRLLERVRQLTRDLGVTVEERDLIREIAIIAERSDVAEEIARLKAHLNEFEALIGRGDGSGRSLEFLVQELGREINTLGSKANDVRISRQVVEMKGLLESIREIVQNVE